MSGAWTTALSTLFAVDTLEHPAWLALLLPLAALALLRGLRGAPPALPWPALREARAAGAWRVDPVRLLAALLRAGALAALAGVLSGPVGVHRAPAEAGAGLDVVLVLDASGSMRALDAEVGGAWRTRLDLAREVVRRFALRRVADGDRVGLVVFGDTAFTLCPLTSDGRLVEAALERVSAGMAGEATALGDALALAVKRALAGGPARGPAPAEPPTHESDARPRPAEGRLVVLLTDGRSNAGSIPTDVAAGLARAAGVRVDAVGIGGEGAVAMGGEGAAGAGLRFERHDLDLETLQRIADASGGRLFPARSSRELERVYAEIDASERVARRAPPRERRSPRPERLLALAGGLLLLEIAATRLVLRRLP